MHNETKEGICIKIESNPQESISLLQHGRRFFVYYSNMAAVTSCENTLLISHLLFQNKREITLPMTPYCLCRNRFLFPGFFATFQLLKKSAAHTSYQSNTAEALLRDNATVLEYDLARLNASKETGLQLKTQ